MRITSGTERKKVEAEWRKRTAKKMLRSMSDKIGRGTLTCEDIKCMEGMPPGGIQNVVPHGMVQITVLCRLPERPLLVAEPLEKDPNAKIFVDDDSEDDTIEDEPTHE